MKSTIVTVLSILGGSAVGFAANRWGFVPADLNEVVTAFATFVGALVGAFANRKVAAK